MSQPIILNLEIPLERPTPEEVEETAKSLSPSQQAWIDSGFCTVEEIAAYFKMVTFYALSMPFMMDSFLPSWRKAREEENNPPPPPATTRPSGLILPS